MRNARQAFCLLSRDFFRFIACLFIFFLPTKLFAQGPYCNLGLGRSIPDAGAFISDSMTVSDAQVIADLNVFLDITHTNVGDLTVQLAHIETSRTTTAFIVQRPGIPPAGTGCAGDDVLATLDDEGRGGSVESKCDVTAPAISDESGALTPNNPLSVFDGQSLNSGTWRLSVVDSQRTEVGTLNGWCLQTPGVVISPTAGLATTEMGGTVTLSVVLTSQPTAQVMIPVSTDNPLAGVADVTGVIFDSSNWNIPQTITVTGVDNFVDDGDSVYQVMIDPMVSLDVNYSDVDLPDVQLTHLDDDTAGIVVSPTSGLVTTEAAGTSTFTIVLTSQPTADVQIDLATDNRLEGIEDLSTVIFDSSNWNIPQTITLTGVDDAVADGNISYSVVSSAAVSADRLYDGLDPADVAATNLDDEAASTLTVSDASVTEGDRGTTQLDFTVTLFPPSAARVTVDYATADGMASVAGADYIPASGTLVFNPGETTQQVSVLVNGETLAEADESVFLNLETSTLAEIAHSQGVGTILNDDTPALAIQDVYLTEGDSGTIRADFTVTLSTPSEMTVLVDYATIDGSATTSNSDYIPMSGTLQFNPGEMSQTISVVINGDALAESDENFFVRLSNPADATLSTAQAVVTLLNDDVAFSVPPSTAPTSSSGAEDDSSSENGSENQSGNDLPQDSGSVDPSLGYALSGASCALSVSADSPFSITEGMKTFLPILTSLVFFGILRRKLRAEATL